MRALGFFENCAAPVVCGERYGVIDESGTRGRGGLIDESGELIVALERDLNLRGIGEEEIGFSRGDGHGFISRDGRALRTFKVDARHYGCFEEGLAVARKGNKDGYIDESGGWVIEPRFHDAEPFRGPPAVTAQPVSAELVEIGYIDREGEAVYRITLGGFLWMEQTVGPRGIAKPWPVGWIISARGHVSLARCHRESDCGGAEL